MKAGVALTLEPRVHEEAVQVVLTHDERHLQEDLEEELGHVAAQEDAFDLHPAPVVGVLGPLEHHALHGLPNLLVQLLLPVDDVHGVAQVEQRGRGHEDDLQHPEAHVRDGELPVVADVVTADPLGVAYHVGPLVTPHALHSGPQDHDTEKEEDAHPDLPYYCGVRLHFVQQLGEEPKVSHVVWSRPSKEMNNQHLTFSYSCSL